MFRQDIENSTTPIRHTNLVRTKGSEDNNSLRSCETDHEDEHTFGQCLYCGKFHSFISCVFRNAKCFRCGKIGRIQANRDYTVHVFVSNAKFRNSNPIELSVSNEHSFLYTISKSIIKSNNSLELNEALLVSHKCGF
ncbi:unnamed protein product [Schistosoma curassoni]|uniref:Uncharacterized protein n=1 Tax=Schistosoma curassoni TaxID=6186 RepID=A0A183JV87_9TREM|nr:unnamed protein product [Schistosoma curassoni]